MADLHRGRAGVESEGSQFVPLAAVLPLIYLYVVGTPGMGNGVADLVIAQGPGLPPGIDIVFRPFQVGSPCCGVVFLFLTGNMKMFFIALGVGNGIPGAGDREDILVLIVRDDLARGNRNRVKAAAQIKGRCGMHGMGPRVIRIGRAEGAAGGRRPGFIIDAGIIIHLVESRPLGLPVQAVNTADQKTS